MWRPRTVQLAALLTCGGLVSLGGMFAPAINAGRQRLNMIGSQSPVENTPPEYAFAIQAFGAFRGLLTDIAFIRAEQYKRAGRYYDAMQLANWICKLQPRFPSVWEFQSWNMAWNISVTTHTPEERWNWVYNGVKLIRDEGLRYNPRAVNLYKQLAWIYVNKMGETLDDFHLAYKTYWAWRMHLLLGAPPDPLGTAPAALASQQPLPEIGQAADPLAAAARLEARRRGKQAAENPAPAEPAAHQPLPAEIVKQACYEWIQAIDDAPRTLDELYARHPAARQMVRALRSLGARISDEPLSEEEYWRRDGLAFTFFARYRRLTDPPSLLAELRPQPQRSEAAPELKQFERILGLRRQDPAGQALLRFLQRKVLSEVYKLETGHMAYLMRFFGPLDWRGVDAHALYWVTKGIIAGGETVSRFGNDKTNTARIIFFALHHLSLRNHIIFEPNPGDIARSYLNMTPDPNFIEPLHRAYLTYGRAIDPEPGPGAGQTYRTGHINFLTRSIQLLYLSGRVREARHYYQYLRDTYSYNSDGTLNENFAKPLRDYVFDTLYETIDTPKQTRIAINGTLSWAFDELAQGRRARYVNLLRWAQRLHQAYMQEKSDRATVRLRLPPLAEMQADVLKVWLSRPAPSPLRTVYKSHLWKNLLVIGQAYLLQRVHDDLLPGLTRECAGWEFDVARAFPEPPGMQQFRQQRPRQAVPQPEKTVETPAQAPGGG